jgi:hypothetical protein
VPVVREHDGSVGVGLPLPQAVFAVQVRQIGDVAVVVALQPSPHGAVVGVEAFGRLVLDPDRLADGIDVDVLPRVRADADRQVDLVGVENVDVERVA